ncbi:MAG: hypothetical protein WC975_13495 [Phycisphaerae bacterium]
MDLENGILCLTFDDSNGNLKQITDLSTHELILKDPRGCRLLRLTIPCPTDHSRMVSTHEGSRAELKQNGNMLTITYHQILKDNRPTGVSAKVTVRLPAGSKEAFFHVELSNQGTDTVDEVVFPWIGGWNGFAGKGKDTITTAMKKYDPHTLFPTMRAHSFGRHNQRTLLASEYHQVHLFDLSGGEHGISCNLYSPVPRIHGLLIENLSPDYVNLCLSWGWVSFTGLSPGKSWTSPEVGLGVHQGDWHESADRLHDSIHRWWNTPPVTDRLRRSIGYHNIQLTGHNQEFYHDPLEIPAIAKDGLRYGVRDLCIWDHKSQTYISYEETPQWILHAETESRLRQALAETRKLGCITSAYVDYWLTVEGNSVYKELSDSIVLSKYGYPVPSNIRAGKQHVDWSAHWLEQGGRILCQRSPKYYQYALELTRRVLALGFDSIFIDGGASWHLCHATNHGHVSPDDGQEGCLDWQWQVMQMVKARNPEGYIFGECPDSFNSQVLDMITRWWSPSEPAEIYRYVLPEVLLPYPVDENDQDLMSKVFARGHQFALMTTNMDGMLSDHPAFATRVQRLADLRQKTADFLALGRFRDNRGLTVEGGDAYSYVSEAGLAVALANSKNEEGRLKVRLAPDALDEMPMGSGKLFLEDGSIQEIASVDKNGTLTLEVTLPAYSNGVWCIPGE